MISELFGHTARLLVKCYKNNHQLFILPLWQAGAARHTPWRQMPAHLYCRENLPHTPPYTSRTGGVLVGRVSRRKMHMGTAPVPYGDLRGTHVHFAGGQIALKVARK